MDNSHKTAIARSTLSAPATALHALGLIKGTVLDYGCGRGADVRGLHELGYRIDGYDPHYQPVQPSSIYDTILCTFVLNVIEDDIERDRTLREMASLLWPSGTAYVTVRRDLERNGHTRSGTWQGHIILTAPAHVVLRRPDAFQTYALNANELRQARTLVGGIV